MNSICVFCGSSSGRSPVYIEAARRSGPLLASQNITLIDKWLDQPPATIKAAP